MAAPSTTVLGLNGWTAPQQRLRPATGRPAAPRSPSSATDARRQRLCSGTARMWSVVGEAVAPVRLARRRDGSVTGRW